MKRNKTGRYITISAVGSEVCRAFVPAPLPPDPPIHVDKDIQRTMEQALIALGRLDSISTLMMHTSLFLYMYVRKEAVLSSQIEGTQSSLADLLLFESKELPGAPLDDVQEVSNYVAAMKHGLTRLREGLPISIRLIKEIHGVLLSKGRGSDKCPGEFRRSQNWIGGTRPGNALYVPPPADDVMECMGALDNVIHGKLQELPVLIRVALVHAQFEAIHPFLDGNGRMGRLLITLQLCAEKVLDSPMLYLSLYFKKRRNDYYALLQQVRTDGDWERWLLFFMSGVKETADLAVRAAKCLADLFEKDREAIQSVGKAAGSALRVHHALQKNPISSIQRLAKTTGLTIPSITLALEKLHNLGIVQELTGLKRGRLFAYRKYIGVLSEGTELTM